MDEEALVILTIFADQYPFMLLLIVQLGEVAAAVIRSFTFSLSLFSPLSSCFEHYSSNTEGLYQLGVSHCPPQSSIEGLEDIEVGSLQTCLLVYLAAKNRQKYTVIYFATAFTKC